jgi:hypothetical protein
MLTTEDTPAWLIDALRKIADDEHAALRVQARIEQELAAKHLGIGVEKRRSIDGLGRLRMEIDPYAHHYWGSRLGYGCWKDKQFLHEFERDNPACRVDSGGTKLQVGYGSLSAGGKKKFTKSYA